MRVQVIEFAAPGGPEVLRLVEREAGPPAAGQIELVQRAIGLNYVDIYQRQGVYPVPALPSSPGVVAAGVVAALGPDVHGLAVGQRVVAVGALGAYASARLVAAERVVPVPDGVTDAQAAALFQGLTAHFLLRRSYALRAGDTIVVHAAAGGVGLILTQWARALGATVIGIVSTPAKAELARAHGCTHVIFSGDDWVRAVRQLTDGEGVAAVYDSVGRDTFAGSLDCLRVGGTLVLFGQASGPAPSLDPDVLRRKGSLTLTFPSSAHLLSRRADVLQGASDFFAAVAAGHVRVTIGQTWPLAEAAAAHRATEQRRTIGSTVLIP